MPFNNTDRHSINSTWNEVPGVYGIYDDQARCIYVGLTHDLKERMANHMKNLDHAMHRYSLSYLLFENIANAQERLNRETVLRRELRPLADGL